MASTKVIVRIEDKTYEVEIEDLLARPVIAAVDGERFEVWPQAASEDAAVPAVQQIAAPAAPPPTALPPAPEPRAGRAIYAPIPGVIEHIAVQPGSMVRRGQELCVLEAMKMKNAIRAPRDGQIAVVRAALGQHVKHHEILMEYAD